MNRTDKNDGKLERTTPLLAGYEIARDWLEKSKRDLDRYFSSPLSLEGSDAMFDVIVTINHIRDWVFVLHVLGKRDRWPNTQTKSTWREYLFKDCPDLKQLADVANAAKHRSLSNPDGVTERLYEGMIIYNLVPEFANNFCALLTKLGPIERVEPAPEDSNSLESTLRHRAHVLRIGDGITDWRYFVDVANRAIQYWDELIEEFEPSAEYQSVITRRRQSV